ncbi:HpcH/HpaI aldolase/citrate lyase family protein [Paraburkholderia phenoliruptrix]|uniref:HpcH/HpaI aldolase/citrate lyase family protein n=1 Tax=Paraburkholderia phenoliruptrix TaxID=252970 RepID=UPI00286997E9|nr:CoA ester lyase [Paraburkholderia phenoliruptrix]WMY11030.1 CoA ester lyase [Paraburkholderia phenoliruptrix]
MNQPPVARIMLPRSYLFVPGNRPDRFSKAFASGADAVILDLEDAVPISEKAEARQEVQRWVRSSGKAYVRVNAAGTQWHDDDVHALASLDGIQGVVLPKAEHPAALRSLAAKLLPTSVLLPLIESAIGFGNLDAICAVPKVQRLMFGTLDFQVDMQMEGTGFELLYFRSQLALASRIACIGTPVDGVTTAIRDARRIRHDTTCARNLGFGGKLCIHPEQIASVHVAFSYSQSEIDWAHRVMDAVNTNAGAATSIDGKMVDAPVIQKAKYIIGRSFVN